MQAGLDGETDTEIVQRLAGLPSERVLPEVYRLTTAASPHLAAERDGVEIDVEGLAKPCSARPRAHHRGRRRPAGAAKPELPADRAVRALGGTGRARRIDAARHHQPQPSVHRSLASGVGFHCSALPLSVMKMPIRNARSPTMGGVRRLGRLPHLDPLDAALSAARLSPPTSAPQTSSHRCRHDVPRRQPDLAPVHAACACSRT